ncbi:hypothetical protein SAMN05660772_00829 [Pasteurella testudinis DSM 23072]|uniref:Uncharacterized protein n=1 Tax=Pasteurella testudinis DSM 23072 TaxID=1122938 RepID=A0A1W1UYT4_9PAST|nr:hypothetical protein [Pasteurella testudinis]SMB86219.1 hypothetical protein SAMN05660772_00829 [Pasteurella testudinis DSM 23072]SUB51751.1 Uncharacterised protein [Pasteurella testudinis]
MKKTKKRRPRRKLVLKQVEPTLFDKFLKIFSLSRKQYKKIFWGDPLFYYLIALLLPIIVYFLPRGNDHFNWNVWGIIMMVLTINLPFYPIVLNYIYQRIDRKYSSQYRDTLKYSHHVTTLRYVFLQPFSVLVVLFIFLKLRSTFLRNSETKSSSTK